APFRSILKPAIPLKTISLSYSAVPSPVTDSISQLRVVARRLRSPRPNNSLTSELLTNQRTAKGKFRMKSATDGLILVGPSLEVLYANPEAVDVFAYPQNSRGIPSFSAYLERKIEEVLV